MSNYNLKFTDLREGQRYDMEGYKNNPVTIRGDVLRQTQKNSEGENNLVLPRVGSKFREHIFIAEDINYYEQGFREGKLSLAKDIIGYIENFLEEQGS